MEVVEQKIKDVVAQHSDQIESAVEDKVEQVIKDKADEINAELDKVEDKVESTIEKVGDSIEKKVDELVPEPLKNVLDIAESNLAEVVDGRVFSCSLFGFLLSLRITRKNPKSSPSKSEETSNKVPSQPALNIRIPEIPRSTSPQ